MSNRIEQRLAELADRAERTRPRGDVPDDEFPVDTLDGGRPDPRQARVVEDITHSEIMGFSIIETMHT